MALLIWVTDGGQTRTHISQRRMSETEMHGKIMQRLKAILFKLLFKLFLGGQKKNIRERPWSTNIELRSTLEQRGEQEHTTHVQAAKSPTAISLRHFSETQETKDKAPVASGSANHRTSSFATMEESLVFSDYIFHSGSQEFFVTTCPRGFFPSNKTAFLDREQHFQTKNVWLKGSQPVLNHSSYKLSYVFPFQIRKNQPWTTDFCDSLKYCMVGCIS